MLFEKGKHLQPITQSILFHIGRCLQGCLCAVQQHEQAHDTFINCTLSAGLTITIP